MKPYIPLTSLWIMMFFAAQAQLTIEDCYSKASENYPLARQYDLIEKSKDFSIGNAVTGYFPTLTLNGQITHQSDVTRVPTIPGTDFSIPALSKNQYKVYGELSAYIYDGGAVKNQKQLLQNNAEVEEKSVGVELYKLKERVNQVYFGVLLLDGRLVQNELLALDLKAGLRKAEARIANGAALKSSAEVMQAELLSVYQSTIELQSMRNAYILMLSQLTGLAVTDSTRLVRPPVIDTPNTVIRPELAVMEAQAQGLDISQKMLNSHVKPRLSAFVQGGYGKPGLNMLNASADSYYIAGARLSWNLTGLYTLRREKEILNLRRKSIDVQRDVLLFNTRYQLSQQNSEVVKLQKLYESDDELIALRNRIKQTALTQLENGVIDATDFIHEATAENRARQNKAIHEIQLLSALYAINTTAGI